MYTGSMETIYLSLRAQQVAVGTFFMKSPVYTIYLLLEFFVPLLLLLARLTLFVYLSLVIFGQNTEKANSFCPLNHMALGDCKFNIFYLSRVTQQQDPGRLASLIYSICLG